MAEHIEREALLKAMHGLHSVPKFQGHQTDEDILFQTMVDVVRGQPTADVVEVVRCCDCIYRRENQDINNTCYLSCDKNWGLRGIIDPTDYCSYGERKKEK